MMLEPTPIGTPVLPKPAPIVPKSEPTRISIHDLWTRYPAFARGFTIGAMVIAVLAFLFMAVREGEWERKTRANGAAVDAPIPANRR